jgi:hypothetical protein
MLSELFLVLVFASITISTITAKNDTVAIKEMSNFEDFYPIIPSDTGISEYKVTDVRIFGRSVNSFVGSKNPNIYMILKAKVVTNENPIRIAYNSGGFDNVTNPDFGKYVVYYESLNLKTEVYVSASVVSGQNMNYRLVEDPTLTNCTLYFYDRFDDPVTPDSFFVDVYGY